MIDNAMRMNDISSVCLPVPKSIYDYHIIALCRPSAERGCVGVRVAWKLLSSSSTDIKLI